MQAEENRCRERMGRYNQELRERRRREGAPPQQTPGAEQPPAPTPGPCAHPAQHTLTVGERGPGLLQDTALHETLGTFVNGRLLGRVVHTKGWGALGTFRPYRSMAPYTRAGFLQEAGRPVPVLARFSLAVSQKGTPDTSRNVRGFSVKFYTGDGVFDLLCNHIPVFLVEDAIQFPAAIAALSPDPATNLTDPERFWRFVAEMPESIHFISWLYSDAGTLASVRTMPGHSVNTYVWVNAQGRRRYVKYHWVPLAGERYLTRQQAAQIGCTDPDAAGRDLHDALARGERVQYELCVQLMDPGDTDCLSYNPLDDTKVWDLRQYPLLPVGRLILDRNPEQYREQVEKAAFSPANLVDGVELSDDKMLQGRSFVYWDAQRRRLGPDFRSIPVNHSPAWTPQCEVTSGAGERVCGTVQRAPDNRGDHFAQAGERYRALPPEEQGRLCGNIAVELAGVPGDVQDTVLGYLGQADPEWGRVVRERMDPGRRG